MTATQTGAGRSAKAELHDLIESFDEPTAEQTLISLRQMLSDALNPHVFVDEDEIMFLGKPLDDDSPLWRLIGIAGSGEPSNVALHKDEYIADSIESIARD